MNTKPIIEIKETYFGERKMFHCSLLAQSPGEAVVLYRLDRNRHLPGVTLAAGDLSIGYFWESRPYNVYHFLNSNGKTLAFYINISEHTHITPRKIYWRDLIVDLLLTPSGGCRILDEDELPTDIDPARLAGIKKACADILANVKSLQLEWERRSAEWLPGCRRT